MDDHLRHSEPYIASQLYDMHGVPALARHMKNAAIQQERYRRCKRKHPDDDDDDDDDDVSFLPYNLDPSVRHVKELVEEVELSLDHNFVKMVKKRDKYIDHHMCKADRKRINVWMKSCLAPLIKEEKHKKDGSLVDLYAETKILYPTEVSLNTYNMIKNRGFVYSKFNTDRDKTSPEVNWSGTNVEYIKEKKKMRIEQALLVFSVMDIDDQTMKYLSDAMMMEEEEEGMFSLDNIDITDENNNKKKDLQEYVDTLFHNYAERLHDSIVKDIDLSSLLTAVDRAIDYTNVLQFVPEGAFPSYNNIRRGGMSFLSETPNGYIPDWCEFVVLQLPGQVKRAYDFRRDIELDINDTSYCHATTTGLEMMLSQELRYSELVHQFTLSLTHKPYIITEQRPPSKGGKDKDKKDDDDDDGEEKHMREMAMMEDKYRLKAREQEMKMHNAQETRALRHEAQRRTQELHALRMQQRIFDHNMKMKEQQEAAIRRDEEQARKMQEAVEKKKNAREKAESLLLQQTTRELERLIESKSSAERADQKERYQLLSGANKAMQSSSAQLTTLLGKLENWIDRGRKAGARILDDMGGEREGEDDERGLVSSDALAEMTSQIPHLSNLLESIERIMRSFGMDIGPGNTTETAQTNVEYGGGSGTGSAGGGTTEEAPELKHISNVLQNRVENILLRAMVAWKRDVGNSQKRVDEMYKRLESLLSVAQDANIPGATTFDYERTLEDFSKEYDDDRLLEMDIDGPWMTEDREAMVQELSGIIRGNIPKPMKVDDEYVSAVKYLRERVKKCMQMLRLLNLENKRLEELYNGALSDKTEFHVRLQATKALMKDVSSINALVSRALTFATSNMRTQMKDFGSKLKTLTSDVQKMNQKYKDTAKSVREQLNELIGKSKDALAETKTQLKKFADSFTSIRLTEEGREAYLKGLNTKMAEKQKAFQDIIEQFTDMRQRSTEQFKEDYEQLMREHQQRMNLEAHRVQDEHRQYSDSIHNQTAAAAAATDLAAAGGQPPPPPPSSSVSQPKKDPLIDELERKKRKMEMRQHRTMVRALEETNKAFERHEKITKSSWNQVNGMKVTEAPNEPTIFHIHDIVRMAEINKPMHKDSVAYLRDELKQKWEMVTSAAFLDIKHVTVNGVTVTLKSLDHTLSTYVIPCIKSLYRDWNSSGRPLHILLKSEMQSSVDTLKNILKIHRIPERIMGKIKRNR